MSQRCFGYYSEEMQKRSNYWIQYRDIGGLDVTVTMTVSAPTKEHADEIIKTSYRGWDDVKFIAELDHHVRTIETNRKLLSEK